MAKTREQKEEIVEKIAELLKTIKSLVFIDYYGLKVKEINNFKRTYFVPIKISKFINSTSEL